MEVVAEFPSGQTWDGSPPLGSRDYSKPESRREPLKSGTAPDPGSKDPQSEAPGLGPDRRTGDRTGAWGSGPRRASLGVTLALSALVFAACGPPRDVSQGIHLVLNPETPAATTTFELRFDEGMVTAEQVGMAAERSPLVLEPPLRGRFVWLSQRSGVFTPEEPLALGREYQLKLRQGLRTAADAPLVARLQRRLRTPDFEVFEASARESGPNSAPPRPVVKLWFNANVRAGAARPYLEFRDAAGQRMAAAVQQATNVDDFFPTWRRSPRRGLTWAETARPTTGSDAPAGHQNRLVVLPESDLPFGKDWRLVVKPGLPSTDHALRLPGRHEFKIGSVVPFEVRHAHAHNGIQDGKHIAVWFNKRLAPNLVRSNLHAWVTLTPTPTNLTFDAGWSTVDLRGTFDLKTRYTLTVRAGFPSWEGFTLPQTYTTQLHFTPLPPRLYFPAVQTSQILGGRRELELLTVNTESIRVRAKRLDPATLIHALRGFRSYEKQTDGDWDAAEPFRGVDFRAVPGRTIYETNYLLDHPVDTPQRLALRWDHILGPHQPGAVFLAAERRPEEPRKRATLGTQALVQLTDLGLYWKLSKADAVVFVFSHTTGQPVPNAAVRLLTDENEPLAERTTDAQGLARLPGSTNAVWVLAQSGADLHAERLADHPVHLWNYGVRYDREPAEETPPTLMCFTDRPVYRPGETVHLKGIVRDHSSHGFVIPAGLQGTLRLIDPMDEPVLETNLTVSPAGSFALSLPLPEGVRGTYRVGLTLGTRQHDHTLSVQDFVPNAFNVTLGARASVPASEPVRIPVAASYYLGAPLTRAKVHWSLEAADAGFAPEGFEDFEFCTPYLDEKLGRNRSAFSAHGDESLSTNLVIAPDVPLNPTAPQPRSVHLRVEITDLNQQTIARAVDFTRDSSEFYLGVKRLRQVARAGERLPLEIVALDPAGRPLPQPVAVTLTVQRLEYETVALQGAGRTKTYRSELHASNVLTQQVHTLPFEKAGIKWALRPDQTPDHLTLPEPGAYLLEARARDRGGHEVVTVTQLYLVGAGELAWDYRNDAQLELIPDQTSYHPGDRATLLVKSPFDGQALVTIERDTVLRTFLTELHGNAASIVVPIEETDAPNVWVSVLLVRGAAHSPKRNKLPEDRLGYCQLLVDNPRTKLQVTVTADAPRYQPGQPVQTIAAVSDAAGQPVPGAEVTLYAVDDGILSLTGYDTPDPNAFFNRPRALAVNAGLSLSGLLPEDPERLVFANKGYLVGGGGRERLRQDFLPCAFWQAALATDAAGRVLARFPAPDSLTRYRVVAVAHTHDSRFGSGQSHFEIRKPLMIEPALPRFANVTDRIVARAVVHNQTETPGAIAVTLRLDGKATPTPTREPGLLDAPTPTNAVLVRHVTVQAHSSGTLDLPLTVTEPGEAKWTWNARFAEPGHAAQPGTHDAETRAFTDSVQSTLNIGHLAPQWREIYLARIEDSTANLLADANPALLAGQGTVTAHIANTRLLELREAISHLLTYPYGCLEQCSSSLLPWIVLRDLPQAGPPLNQTPAEADSAIRTGIRRLASMRHAQGGLTYWPGGSTPTLWGSAYGGMVLALARQAGFTVPSEPFGILCQYLAEQLRGSADARRDVSARCLALYTLALAGRSEPAYHELLFKMRAQLSAENRALLALAILESQGPASMIQELLTPTGPAPASDDGFGNEARALAVQLLAWSRFRPADPRVDVLTAELMRRRSRAHWGTTQADAWGVYALTDYARRVEGALTPAHGTLTWAGQTQPYQLGAAPTRLESRWRLSDQNRASPLELANPAQRRLYTQVIVESRSPVPLPPRQDRGYAIRRGYAKLDDDGHPRDVADLRVGDRVLVTLDIQAHQTAHYVAVEDPLPALFEAVNPEFKSQETRPVPGLANAGLPWFSDFRELRADRALFFRDHLEPGCYTLRYLARVRAAGTATAPAAKVEEMYHPERFGLSETITVTAHPWNQTP